MVPMGVAKKPMTVYRACIPLHDIQTELSDPSSRVADNQLVTDLYGDAGGVSSIALGCVSWGGDRAPRAPYFYKKFQCFPLEIAA